jgi:hypothetical protein
MQGRFFYLVVAVTMFMYIFDLVDADRYVPVRLRTVELLRMKAPVLFV